METIRINCTGAATMPISRVVALQGNLKELSTENYGKLLDLMIKEGFAFPLAVARIKGKPYGVIDGHQRHRVIAQAIADGGTLVDAAGRKVDALPVVWVECRDKKHAARLILAAVSQFGRVTDDGLYAFVNDQGIGFDELAGYDLPDFDTEAFVEGYAPETREQQDAEPQIDQATELQKKWQVKTGQLWTLGEHRLLCGDSTKAEDVERVMGGRKAIMCVTSPPYWLGKDYEKEKTRNEVVAFQQAIVKAMDSGVDRNKSRIIINTGTYWKNRIDKGKPEFGLLLDEWIAAFRDFGWVCRHVRIWAKGGGPLHLSAHADLIDTHWEFIATFYDAKAVYGGQRKCGQPWAQQGVWSDIPGASMQEGHSAPFPVEIPFRNIMLYSDEGDKVYEPFSGSGTTIIACEQLSRKCRAIEIDPKYVAVALQRWADATGKTPTLEAPPTRKARRT